MNSTSDLCHSRCPVYARCPGFRVSTAPPLHCLRAQAVPLYRAIAVVREDAKPSSKQSGEILPGEELICTQAVIVEDTLRLKSQYGWVGLHTAKGNPLIEVTHLHSGAKEHLSHRACRAR